jgi:hypothetical protein
LTEKRENGILKPMKTTIDLPDPLFRKAKATAAERGISLKHFITEAVENRLMSPIASDSPSKPWMRAIQDLPRVPKNVLKEVANRVAAADLADIALQESLPQ